MPALQPPSMQIGALPPGASTLTPQPGGPALQPNFQYAPPVIIQSVVAVSTGAAQPTSASVAIAATQPGSLLVAFICGMAQGGAQNTPIPTNFKSVGGAGAVAGTSCASQWAYLPGPSNAGGITTVNWTTLTNYSSYAAVVFEIGGIPPAPPFLAWAPSAGFGGAFSNSNAPTGQSYTPGQTNAIAVGLAACASTQTFTSSSLPASGNGAWTVGAVSTSTNSQASVVNTSVTPFSAIASGGQTPPTWQLKGALGAGAPCLVMYAIIDSLGSFTLTQAPSRAIVVDGGAGYAVGDTGQGGWSLGSTKPGGAGGGQ